MKKIVLSLALILSMNTISFASTSISESTESVLFQETKGKKFAILVQSTKNLRSSIMTASEMIKDNPAVKFEIVIMGQMVQELNNAELKPELDAADKAGIKLVVCEFALKVYGVELKDLPSYFIGTPNAHKYMFQLQEKNYNTLSI
ncbi:hypothetical protein [Myroides sp. LoEW2-1]|uniref:hypothetical protein n=1 Tax=Myroides sp. LoEW2-1 TaxID=2683192 RepID=UPI001327AD8A|nr:hypothetical protein [Myroides sp. LoEW2-1]MVX35039.1 hypothetical protein [Myroides sp. LoEW2-1]